MAFYMRSYPNSMVLHEVKRMPSHVRQGILDGKKGNEMTVPATGYRRNEARQRAAAAKMFLDHCEEARVKLVQIMGSRDATAAEQLRAAIEILDRGLGKPVTTLQMEELSRMTDGPAFNPEMLKGMDPKELRGALQVIAALKGTAVPLDVNSVVIPAQDSSGGPGPDSSGGPSDSSGGPSKPGADADQHQIDVDDFLDG